MSEVTYYTTEAKDVLYRATLHQDTRCPNPREGWDHYNHLDTKDDGYYSPDKDNTHEVFDKINTHFDGIPYEETARYIRAFRPDVKAFGFLERDGEGGLRLIHPDDGLGTWLADGLAIITVDQWNETMGADYTGDVTPYSHLEDAVEEYNAWCTGEVYGVVVDVFADGGWVRMDNDCWGLIGYDYAASYAKEQVLDNYQDNPPVLVDAIQSWEAEELEEKLRTEYEAAQRLIRETEEALIEEARKARAATTYTIAEINALNYAGHFPDGTTFRVVSE